MVSLGGKPTRISCGVWLAGVLLAAALLSGSEARVSRLDKSAASLQAATAALALAEDALKDSSARGSPALLERDETWAAGDDQTFDVNAVVPHDSTWTVISSGLHDHDEEGDTLEEGDSADDAEEEWDNERTADGDMATDDEDEDGPLRQLSASQLHRVSALEDLGEMGQMRFAEPYSQLIVQLPPNNTQSSNSTNSSTPTNNTRNSTAPAAAAAAAAQPINPGPVGPVGPVGSVGPIGPKGPTGATGNIDDVVKGKLRVLHGKIKVADQHLQRLQRLEEAVFPEWYQRPEACPDHWIRLAYYNNEERVHCRPPISEDQQPKNPNCNIVALFPRTFDRHEWCTRCKASWKKYGCHFNERGEVIAPIKILPPSADSLEVNWPPKA